jgi:GNAT superfamily N-acetyltransferase/putative sterol carrier protein
LEQDYMFQLDAGYALRKIGHEKAKELSENLRDENDKPVVDIEVEHDCSLRFFPRVKGYRVANVFTEFEIQHFPANTHITIAYVQLVHTLSPYRRKGISRRAMQETFAHRAVRRCSCAYLGTGTRNTAHSMYKSFGFVDIGVDEFFTKELGNEKAKIVEGLSIRSYLPGDEVGMAALANERPAVPFGRGSVKARRPRLSNTCIKIAEKDGEMIGYALAWAGRDKESACLSDICVKETDIRKDTGLSLLCALHNELASRGYKKINVEIGYAVRPDFLRDLLHSFGYSFQPTGVVVMFKVIDLPMLLEELSSLLVKRLSDSDYKDWYGKIGIVGKQHKAGLSIGNGAISVLEEVSEDMDILISADDDTITKVIAGIMTPYEAYLQTELSIRPMVNNQVTELLEALFPRIPIVWLES